MAYNPFNIFRRNQKALFAVLTVFIMVMFTLQSGVAGGDFFESFTRWLGAKGGSKEVVCKIDGHKVTVGELEGPRGLQYRRVIANRFMFFAALRTVDALRDTATMQRAGLSKEGQGMADAAQRALQAMDQLDNPRTAALFQSLPQLRSQYEQDIVRGQQFIYATIESPDAKSEDKEVARAFRTIIILRRSLQGAKGEHYFVNAPNKTRADLVEFMLWQKKADQLGIRFSQADVKKLIQTEFYGAFTRDVEVREMFRQTPGFTMESCFAAIGEEFRVRAAQTAVLGPAGRFHGAPAVTTPFETFEFYREQTSPASYEVVAVPAAAFVEQVTAMPTENEINDLFKKYGDAEPNPRSETPGFKEPRRIAVGWLGIQGDEPYYKALAAEQFKVGEMMAKFSGALAVPLPGTLETWAAGVAAPLSIKEPAVDAAYTKYTTEFRQEMMFGYSTANPSSRDLLASSTVKAGVIAAAVGAFAGPPMAGVVESMGAPIAYEIRDRAKVGLPAVVGTIPGPSLLPTTLAGLAAARVYEPKPLPIETMRPELMKLAIDKRARVLAFGERPDFNKPEQAASVEKGDIARFIEELGKLTENGKAKDPAAVNKYIQDFKTTRGLAHSGASTTPRDEWTLQDDPNLKPLVEARAKSLSAAQGAHGGEYIPFGQSFFWTSTFDQATFRPRRGPATSGNYQAQTYPPGDPDSRADGRLHYVVWRTEDVPPKKTNLVTARPAVVAAWKRLQAREKARDRANKLADAIRKSSKTDPYYLDAELRELRTLLEKEIQDPKAKTLVRKFTIANVAPITTGMMGLQRFGVPDSENIPYPTPDMATALLDNRDKAAKTVLVLPDAPKDTYYVATLFDRKLKTPSEFVLDVYSPSGRFRGVATEYQIESTKRYRDSVLDLIRKEFNYEATDDQKKKLEQSTKLDSSTSDF